MRIKEYFYGKQNVVLILLSLAVLFLVVRGIPFLNIIFPDNATLSVLFVVASFMLNWYKSPSLYLLLGIATGILYFIGSNSQAEQLAILAFVILSILIVQQTIQLFKDES